MRTGIVLLLFAGYVSLGQDASISGGVVANLNATITPSGALKGTLIITASGTFSAAYREAFLQNPAKGSALLGSFTRSRELHATPFVIGDGSQGRPLQIEYQINEDEFLTPIQRQVALQLDLLILLAAPVTEPDGSQRFGTEGLLREEIALNVPPDYTVESDTRVNNENAFARYRSETKAAGGKVAVVRELQIKQETISGSKITEASGFLKSVSEDQHRAFVLRRMKRVDLTAWIQSVAVDKLNRYASEALQEREYDAARRLLERATQANPNDQNAWNNLGRAFISLGKLEDAQKVYETQIATNPKNKSAYNNLALVEEREGYLEMAIDNLRKVLELSPGDLYATANLPRVLFHAGRWAEAEEAASKAVQAQPNNVQQKLYAAVSGVCVGKAGERRQAIDSALGANPNGALLNDAAFQLTECGQNDLAEAYITKALAALPLPTASQPGSMTAAIGIQNARGVYLDTYGWLLHKKGEEVRALEVLRAAIALRPRAAEFVHLAEVESKAGHNEEAARYWREAVYLEPGRRAQVPPVIAAEWDSMPPLSLDRIWYPLGTELPADSTAALPTDQPSYFFVALNADGSVQSVRELDSDDEASKRVSPALRNIKLAEVRIDDKPIPSVYIVKVVRGEDGKVFAGRSIGPEAVAIASDLMPGEFPLPDTATPAAPASTGAPSGAYQIGGGITPPRIKYKVEPEYSAEAQKAKLEGTVLLTIVVDQAGTSRDIKIKRPLGLGLDEKAVDAVSRWQFYPGMKGGDPVNVQAQIEVNFRLLNKTAGSQWHISNVEFHVPDGSLRPFVDKVAAPHVSDDAVPATATVSFDINEKGAVLNLHVEKSSDDNWGHDLSDALAKWKFSPASKDGNPISVSCTMEFVRGS